MKWNNMSGREMGRRQQDLRFSIRGDALDITIWRHDESSDVWYVNSSIGTMFKSVRTMSPRQAKIEAIRLVSLVLEKSMADLNMMKTASLG